MPNGFGGDLFGQIERIRRRKEQRRIEEFPELSGVPDFSSAVRVLGVEALQDPNIRSRVLERFGTTEEQAAPIIGAAQQRAQRARLRQFQVAAANIEDEINDLIGEIDRAESDRAQLDPDDRVGQEIAKAMIASRRQQIQNEARRLQTAFPDVAATPEGQAILNRFRAISAIGQIDASLLQRGARSPTERAAPRGIGQPFPPATLEAIRSSERGGNR